MFVQEARIASLVHHANIAAIIDFGVEGGVPFQVMEFVDGADARSLQEQAAELGESMPVEFALHVVTEVAHALACAHRARGVDGQLLGVVHRDVSPRNILISWNGDVKLTDFGIAFSKDRLERTRTGTSKGTPPYMAPEQTLGGDVDQRTDIFSLGCVLQALVAGRSPLSVESNMVRLLSGGAMVLDAALPEDVRGIVARATRYAKAERYESAAEMAAATGAALHRRIDRGPKTMVLEWLARIRPPSRLPPEPRGRLDDLLDPQMMLEAGEQEPGRFVVAGEAVDPHARTVADLSLAARPSRPVDRSAATQAERARSHPRSGTESAPVRDLDRATVDAAPPRRGRVPATFLVGSVVGLAAVAAGALLVRANAASDAVAAAPDTSTRAAFLPPPARAEATASAPVQPAEAGAVTIADEASVRHAPTAHARPAASQPVGPGAVVPVPVRAPPDATGTGMLLVAGEGALRGEVFVDGRSVGFAPKEFELPVGSHTVVLAAPDGHRVGPTTIAVTPRNTASAPAEWKIP